MTFTPVEWIALAFVVLGLIKLLVILVNKMAWYNSVAGPIFENTKASAFVFVVLGLVVFYFLIGELSIVQIFGVMAFTSLFIGAGLLAYSKDFSNIIKKTYKQKFGAWIWLYSLVWLALSLWALYALYMSWAA